MSALPIPEGPDALTAGWLSDALVENESVRGAEIESLAPEALGGVSGLIGLTVRVRVCYKQPATDAPHSLIAKFPRRDCGETRELSRLNLSDVRFYQDLLNPTL